jgi:hypothetical protein
MLSLAVDDTGGGAAGSVYLTLILTNTSGQPCEINGYPGVSLVGNGAQLGAAAVRDDTKPGAAFSLAPGARAAAELQYNQPGKYPNCTQVQADGIKVFPPNSLNSMTVARPMTACSNTDLDLLRVGAFQPR